jgi:hypothetical protein
MLAGTGNLRRPLAVLLTASITVLASIFIAPGHMNALAAPRAPDHGPQASAQNFEESLGMRITKKDGSHISAKGTANGSVDGKVSFKIHTLNGSKATATFYGHNSQGTISGTGVATYQVSGAVSHYAGKINILTGTGKYSHASSRGIFLSGTVNRRSYSVTMSLAGKWHA